jgi:hypothetical protein
MIWGTEFRDATCELFKPYSRELMESIQAKYRKADTSGSGKTSSLPGFYNTNLAHPTDTRAFTAKAIMDKIEHAAKVIYDELQSNAPNWEVYSNKTNYIVHHKIATTMIQVKIETVLPYSLLDIATLLANPRRQVELDSTKGKFEILRRYSNHTWMEYSLYATVRVF